MRFTEDDFFFEESSSVDDIGFLSFARPEVKELPYFGIGVFQKFLNFGTPLYSQTWCSSTPSCIRVLERYWLAGSKKIGWLAGSALKIQPASQILV
jgi:hypothetical protein